ncbi:MAG: cupin domain-containing protein [Nitrospinota bacterium]
MKLKHYKDVALKEEMAAQGAGIRWLLSERDGETGMAMRVIEIAPGGQTPDHSHPWEHQVFILRGAGRVVSGGEEKRFGPGDAIFIAPGERHIFHNDSAGAVEFVCMIPAGAAKAHGH